MFYYRALCNIYITVDFVGSRKLEMMRLETNLISMVWVTDWLNVSQTLYAV